MALISCSYSGGFVVLNLFGIKCKFNVKRNYLYMALQQNKIYMRSRSGKLRQIYHSPKGFKIYFKGKNSTIILTEKSRYTRSELSVHSNCSVDIQKTTTLGFKDASIYCYDNSALCIGESFNIESGRFLLGEGSALRIGEDCMFSNRISIFTYDGHAVLDNISQEVINKPSDITIGNHVWLGRNSAVLKGSVISDNSIVAYNAVVNSKIEESNVILAGIPAKIVKRNINWQR